MKCIVDSLSGTLYSAPDGQSSVTWMPSVIYISSEVIYCVKHDNYVSISACSFPVAMRSSAKNIRPINIIRPIYLFSSTVFDFFPLKVFALLGLNLLPSIFFLLCQKAYIILFLLMLVILVVGRCASVISAQIYHQSLCCDCDNLITL